MFSLVPGAPPSVFMRLPQDLNAAMKTFRKAVPQLQSPLNNAACPEKSFWPGSSERDRERERERERVAR